MILSDEETAPKRGLYRAPCTDEQLDAALTAIEQVKGIIGAFAVRYEGKDPELEILVNHPLDEAELAVFRSALPDGEYSVADQVLMPVRLVSLDPYK